MGLDAFNIYINSKAQQFFMNETPTRITIVIPAYNVEGYIAAALDSVFNQESPVYEVIVVNDGSTDSTNEKINQYAHHPELRIVTTENQGQGLARNLGLRQATGDYVYFLDADDLIDKYFLQTVTQLIIDEHADLILFSGDSFYDAGKADDKCAYVRPFEASNLVGDEAVARLVQAGTPSPSPCLYISKVSLWRDNQIRFKDIIHEDDEIFIRLILAASNVTILQDVLFHRRIRAGSTIESGLSYKNARGLFIASSTLVEIHQNSLHRPKPTRRAIRKRAIRTAQRYMRVCKKVGMKPNTRSILRHSVLMRSIDLALGACIYTIISIPSRSKPPTRAKR